MSLLARNVFRARHAVLIAAFFVSACAPPADANHAVEALQASQQSGRMVAGAGVVKKLLSDDNEGARHQRFILELPSGLTVLVAHNIDIAPRIDDLAVGGQVNFYGQYEWNARGGVIHWTHRAARADHSNGWLEYHAKRYQ